MLHGVNEASIMGVWAACGWASGESPISLEYRRKFAEFYRGVTEPRAHFPRDEWLYAFNPLDDAGGSQEYVVHLREPEMVCRIREAGSPPRGRPTNGCSCNARRTMRAGALGARVASHRACGEPEDRARSNFADPDSSIMKTGAEGFRQCCNAQVAAGVG